MTMKGALIAASVAGLFAGASSLAFAADEKEGGDQIMCSGINACKGQGACAGGGHGCAGKNGCKGKGLTKTSKEDCKAKGGKEAKAKEKK
jgi:uncharacterized membrane protein